MSQHLQTLVNEQASVSECAVSVCRPPSVSVSAQIIPQDCVHAQLIIELQACLQLERNRAVTMQVTILT